MAKKVTTKTSVKIGDELLIEYNHDDPVVILAFTEVGSHEPDVEVNILKDDVDDLISELCAARDLLWPPPKDLKEVLEKHVEALAEEEPAPKTNKNGKERAQPA